MPERRLNLPPGSKKIALISSLKGKGLPAQLVRILADQAEPACEIDRIRAEASRDRAETRLRLLTDAMIDRERARAAFERADIRLQVVMTASTGR